ncbi:MAG TPA: diacylglycerol kinase family protein [Streptosporangiaceae bacterium]
MNEPLCLVVNPAAGGGRALRTLASATAALDGASARYQVQPSASLAHARELAAAAAQRGEVTVAVGGDGLAGALAGAVADAGGVMALIPAGRGNDLARELGLPPGAAAAAAAILDGQQAELDLLGLSIPGQPEETAALSAYLGLPSVAGEIANRSRLIRGPATYPVAALRALARWRPVSFRVEQTGGPGGPVAGIPAGEFPGYGVVLANSRFFGGGMQVCPPARTSDGCLDVVVMHDATKAAFLRVLLHIKDGTHVSLPQVALGQAAAVTVTADTALPVAADGETLPWGSPLAAGVPLRARVRRGALKVIVPAGPGH